MAVFETTYRVTWSDVDAAQVVHHSNYFRFFERAEEAFYEHLGLGLSFFMKYGIWFPRIEVFCRYHAPARFGDKLGISLSIEEIKEKVVKYGFIVRKDDADILVAEGHVVVVAADKEIGKSIKIPSEIIEKLRTFKNS